MATKATLPVITNLGLQAAIRQTQSDIRIRFTKVESFERAYNPSPSDTAIDAPRETVRIISIRTTPDGLQIAALFDSDAEYDIGGYAIYIEDEGSREVLFAVMSDASKIQAKKLQSEEIVFKVFFRLKSLKPGDFTIAPADSNFNITVAKDLMRLTTNMIRTQTEVLKMKG